MVMREREAYGYLYNIGEDSIGLTFNSDMDFRYWKSQHLHQHFVNMGAEVSTPYIKYIHYKFNVTKWQK